MKLTSCATVLAITLCAHALQAQGTYEQSVRPDEGFTEPLKKVLVASPESGVLQLLSVREGDMVCKGDKLCQLDSLVLEVSLKAAKAKLQTEGKLKAAQATLANKQHLLQQMQNLLEREHASDKEVRQAQLDLDLAEANLETAQNENRANEIEVEKIEAQIQRRIIRAPTDGVVLELPRQEGEAITSTEGHVATIVQLNQLRVRYFLSTAKAMHLKQGDQATVSFPATSQVATAIVDFVAPVTDSNSGTVRVELLIENPGNRYRSGLRCVLLESRSTVSAIRIGNPKAISAASRGTTSR